MAVICNTCGLPEDLCACGELEKDSTHIIIRLETRRFRKKGTMIDSGSILVISGSFPQLTHNAKPSFITLTPLQITAINQNIFFEHTIKPS